MKAPGTAFLLLYSLSAASSAAGEIKLAYLSEQDPTNVCDIWKRECARLYGAQTRQWVACMRQPNAKFDCENAETGSPLVTSQCENWHRNCAGLYGHNTRRYNACMRQPQALVDCRRY